MFGLTKWLNILILLVPAISSAQALTLDKAQELARTNYPLIRQKDLIRQTAGLNISNLHKSFLPQLSLSGQASYQSDVTKVDVPIAGFKIDPPEKDQYKFTADVNQLIYDGGNTRHQKAFQQLNEAVGTQEIEVELFKLKERINEIFLGVLYVDEQIVQVGLVKKDLQTGLQKVEAQVDNGIAFRSNANILKAELIKSEQRLIELQSTRNKLIETLSLFINMPVSSATVFEKPVIANTDTTVTRPELTLFRNQHALLEQQNKLIRSRNLPRTSLFLQGGYGRPALNLLKNDFDFFYIGGIRLNWSLSGLYTKHNDRQLVKVNQDLVDVKKDLFMLNTNAEIKESLQEIRKLQQLIAADNQIVQLRQSVTQASKAQLENGVITASDYLREVNAEDLARQQRISHEIQLLQARINYNTTLGK